MDFDLFIRESITEKIDPMLDKYHTFYGCKVENIKTGELGTIITKDRYEELRREEYSNYTHQPDESADVLIEFEDGHFCKEAPARFINRYKLIDDNMRNNLTGLCRPTNATIDAVMKRLSAVEKVRNRE